MNPELTETKPEYKEVDIFAWANNLFEFKETIKFELFLISKQHILYRTKLSGALDNQLHPLFLDEIVEFILAGAQKGLEVRPLEEAESEENVLQRTKINRVDGAVEVLDWLKNREADIEQFIDKEHDFKRMKGLVIRCSHAGMQPFYIIKQLPRAQMMKGEGAWVADSNSLAPVVATVLRIPADNQLLAVSDDLFVFNEAKLERLFGYNAKKNALAEKKVRAIQANFKLSFADDLDMQTMVKGNKAVIKKLQNIDPTQIKQDQLMDQSDELGLDLMLDEDGAIIIMNNKDLVTFVNLLNDDYVESNLTGNRYEIKSKKPLKPRSSEE